MFSDFTIHNPKRDREARLEQASWYPYYAGFSPHFAYSLLASSGLHRTACIVDPWNGSGTTTAAAATLGYRTYGYDLNPVMVIVAKARLFSQREKSYLWAITAAILQASKDHNTAVIVEDDPLCTWLVPRSVIGIRQLERALRHLLANNVTPSELGVCSDISQLSPLAAFFYTALFRTARVVLKPFYASNPTWMKIPHDKDARLHPPLETLLNIFQQEVKSMIAAISCDPFDTSDIDSEAHVAVASSDALPFSTGQFLTSKSRYRKLQE